MWTLPSQKSKEMFRWTCILFLYAPIFCWRLSFVDTYLLSTPIFCWQPSFVEANILLTPIFCWHQYFVLAYLLSTPIFCRCLYLLMLIFSWRRFFVGAFSQFHTTTLTLCKTCVMCPEVIGGLTARSQLLEQAGVNIHNCWGAGGRAEWPHSYWAEQDNSLMTEVSLTGNLKIPALELSNVHKSTSAPDGPSLDSTGLSMFAISLELMVRGRENLKQISLV